MKIKYGLLVIYNKSVNNSKSYCSLRDYHLKTIVVDNSENITIVSINQKQVEKDKNIYLNMNGNKGLSKAYNAALSWIFEHSAKDKDYIAIFDDDTVVPKSYFDTMSNEVGLAQAQIYLPIVKDQLGILSPSKMNHFGYCHRINSLEELTPDNICGINSGMVVQISIYQNYRYNEAMFLDYIDHFFIRDMRTRKVKIKVVDTILEQTFSSISDDKETACKRLSIFKKDIKVFYQGKWYSKFLLTYTICRRIMRHIYIYKDISILWKL